MEINDILAQMGGLQTIARELGISESQAASGAAGLLPAILGGFKKQAEAQPTGLEGLGGGADDGDQLATSGGDGVVDGHGVGLVAGAHHASVEATRRVDAAAQQEERDVERLVVAVGDGGHRAVGHERPDVLDHAGADRGLLVDRPGPQAMAEWLSEEPATAATRR